MCVCVCVCLTNGPQVVKSGSAFSNIALTNLGARQGTVLSPSLFSLYTADCGGSHNLFPTDKFSDDTALIVNDED